MKNKLFKDKDTAGIFNDDVISATDLHKNLLFSDCYSYEEADECTARNGTYYRRQCYSATEAAMSNITHQAEQAIRRPPAEEYFS
jgi:hypothetical protein